MRSKKSISPAIPTISDAEWEVMKVLWASAPLTTNEVVEALAPHKDWKPKTIHTLLRRLAKKGALVSEKRGREFAYVPQFTEEECQLAESRTFLGRVFNGQMAPFLATFLGQARLSQKELNELKRILEDGK